MISPSELKKFVEDNPKLVLRRESKRYPGLFVLKYKREVFYQNLWHLNPLLLECRGLVVDKDYNIIVKPFTKVFNYGENGATIDRDEVCTYVRKVNGFLGVVTYDRRASEDLIYSTTGSLDSEFVDLIAKHVDPLKDRIMQNIVGTVRKDKTILMFEICDPSDPHIIPEEYGAWLIGGQLTFDGPTKYLPLLESSLDAIARMIGAKRPEWKCARFSEIVKMANECTHEGFMVYGLTSGTAMKIKSPYYLTSKFIARMSDKKYRMIFEDKKTAYQNFDEEFYPLIDHIRNNSECFKYLSEQGRLDEIRRFLNETNNK